MPAGWAAGARPRSFPPQHSFCRRETGGFQRARAGPAETGPVPPYTALKELIEELVNITQNQKAPLCNGSMVWSINMTAGVYCAALESLINVSGCSAIEKTQRMLSGFCPHKVSAGQFSSLLVRDTKIEVAQFVKDLLRHLRKLFHQGKFN
ncbi:interleukin-13 isoform X1 [Aotus nancymaae]